MRINYNVSSIIAKNALNNNDSRLTLSTQKLSSGYKINSAKDDAAGLAIARKMNIQIKALERANQNANDGLSVVDTADGAMSEMHSILQRMNELSVQAANGTNSDSDRAQIQLEIDELVDEIDRIADTSQFNAQNLLDGSFAYKAYTNTENVKVMSYSDDVSKGIYKIDQIIFDVYGDETTEYADGSNDDVKTDVEYKINNDNNVIKNALNRTADSANSVQAFPAGATVSVDEEYIYISDDDGFEMKLYVDDIINNTVNNKNLNGVINADVQDTLDPVITKGYTNLVVTDDTGKEYTIGEFYIKTEDDETTAYSDSKTEALTSLAEDLGIDNISKVEVDEANDTIKVTYTENNTEKTLTLTTTNLDTGWDSQSTRTKTRYTIGTKDNEADSITIDVTKMGPMIIQTGANEGQQLDIEIPQLNSRNLGINDLSVSTEDDATAAIDKVADAINYLSSVRSKIGAYANRLEHTITNLDTTEENMTEAYSRIMDTDMAEEMTEYTSVQVLVQAATSVLAQANERPQQVLQLLQ